ncbi:unnamed protein product [Ixodes hexagonus]
MPGREIERMAGSCCGRRARRPDGAMVKAALGVLLGLFLALSGLASYVFFPTILKTQVELNLILEPGNEVYAHWQEVPIPIYVKYYFFNVTNPNEVLEQTEKPRLEEVGPYTFRETREKVNITWNPNGTVSYRQIKRYYLQADMTKGSLDDEIITLNMPMVSAAHAVRFDPDDDPFFKDAVSEILSDTQSSFFVRRSMRELLFEGYEDAILGMVKSIGIEVPSSKFGWLLNKNGTEDGEFTIFTGSKGMHNYGEMDKYNGLNETSAFHGYCNMINGTGKSIRGILLDKELMFMFVYSCRNRSIRLSYLGDVETRGVKLRRYWGEGRLFDYADRDNQCFCTGTCFPSGVLNISACQHGAPVAISFPHFLYGDPSYQQAVEGISPDPKRHQMYLDIEPKMGITVNAAAKFQVNVIVERIPGIPQFENITLRRFYPIFWSENLASADKGMLSKVRLVTEELPQYVTVGSFGAVIIGGIVLLATLVYAIRYTRRPKPIRPTYIPVTVLK